MEKKQLLVSALCALFIVPASNAGVGDDDVTVGVPVDGVEKPALPGTSDRDVFVRMMQKELHQSLGDVAQVKALWDKHIKGCSPDEIRQIFLESDGEAGSVVDRVVSHYRPYLSHYRDGKELKDLRYELLAFFVDEVGLSFDVDALLNVLMSAESTVREVDYLVDKGANVAAVDASGSTPLHNLLRSDRPDHFVVARLLEQESPWDAADDSGKTPFDLAFAVRGSCDYYHSNVGLRQSFRTHAFKLANGDGGKDGDSTLLMKIHQFEEREKLERERYEQECRTEEEAERLQREAAAELKRQHKADECCIVS